MSDRLYDELGSFSKNVLKVWEEEQQREKRRKRLAAVGVPTHVVKALNASQHRRGQRNDVSRSHSSMARSWADDNNDRRVWAPRSNSSAAMLGDGADDDVEEEQLPSMHQVALVNRLEDRPLVLSSDAPQSWSTSFHHLHHESKKRERIRRLERLRLDREAQELDAVAVREANKEALAKTAAAAKLSGIQKTTRRLHQTLEHLHDDEEVVRRQGFRRVQDTVRHSLLRQCGDTMPVAGECVRLLPLTLVEDAFHHYGLVCPHDLLHWSDAIGHVVEVTPLKYAPSTPSPPLSSPPGTTATHHKKAATKGQSPHSAHDGGDVPMQDYQVVVRFGLASQGASHVFELFASCLELAADPSLVPAPLVVTDQGILLELTKLSITFEVVGDVAIVTHQSSWVAPRVVQKLGAYTDIALLCPLDDAIRLTSVAADVGDSKLRSIALDEQDGKDFVKKCQQSRTFRLQQVQSRSDGDSATSASNVKTSHPIFTSGDADPLAFVSDDVSNALPTTGIRALGLWQDTFQVLAQPSSSSNTTQGTLAEALGEVRATSPAARLAPRGQSPGDDANSPFSTKSAGNTDTADWGSGQMKGTLIPLKQLKVSELVHLQLQFQITGSHVQRSTFHASSTSTGDHQHHRTMPTVSNGSAPTGGVNQHHHLSERAVDFRFPCCYPDACFNYDARRTFESMSSLTVCVVGGDARHVKVHSAPRTSADESPLLSAAYLKCANAVVVSQLSGVWANHDIRLQLTHPQHGPRNHNRSTSTYGATPDTSKQPSANDDVDAVMYVDSHPALQLDFFTMRIATPFTTPPELVHGEPPLRRLINVLVDLRTMSSPNQVPTSTTTVLKSGSESPSTEGGVWGATSCTTDDAAVSSPRLQEWIENVYCAILDLVGRLGSEDLMTLSVLRDDHWAMLLPHEETSMSQHHALASGRGSTLHVSGAAGSGALTARSMNGNTTSRVPHATPRGDLRSHRASSTWWRRAQLSGHDHTTHFFARWMAILTTQPAPGPNVTSVSLEDPKVVSSWVKAHQHMSSMVHSEHGREDIREAFVFTATPLSKEAQQHLAHHTHSSSQLSQYRIHVGMLRPPPAATVIAATTRGFQGGVATVGAGVIPSPSTTDLAPQMTSSPSMFLSPSLDPLSLGAAPSPIKGALAAAAAIDELAYGTSLVWQMVSRRTRGSILVVPEGHSSQRLLMGLVSCEYSTSDVDVSLPSASDVALLGDLRNLPLRGGGVIVTGVASYGGSVSIASGTRVELNGGSSVSPIENVTLTARFSSSRKCVKRVAPVKLPPGALSNVLATKAMQYEVAASWFSRLVAAAGFDAAMAQPLNNNTPSFRSTSTGGGSATTNPGAAATALHCAAMLDVVECGCLLGAPLRRGPYALESIVSSASNHHSGNLMSYSPPLSVQGSVMLSPTYQHAQSPVRNGAASPQPSIMFSGHSTKLYLFHQIVAPNNGVGGGNTQASSVGGLRQGAQSLTAAAYPPRLLGPPSAISATLALGCRNWRETSRQSCQSQHLEMSIFVPFASSLEDCPPPPPTTNSALPASQPAVFSLMNPADATDSGVPSPAPALNIATGGRGSILLGWVIQHNARFHTRVSQLVAEEYAVRGEHEFVEWNEFLELARDFHQHGAAVQLHQLDALRDVTCFMEEERLMRVEMVREETTVRQHLCDSTADARALLKRCGKHLREARQHLIFQEEDARKAISDDVLRVQEVVRRSLQHSLQSNNNSHATAVPPTSTHAEFMLCALETFQGEPETVALLCCALITWALVPLHAQLLGHHGGVARMKVIFQAYARNARVVELIVRVLHLLSKVAANHCKIEQSNVIGEVLAAMQCHSRHEAVQLRCAQFFASTSKVSQGMRLAVLKSPTGGIEQIMTLLTLWSHNHNINRQTFRVIRNLVMEPMAHRYIAEEGIPALVSAVSNLWVDNPSVATTSQTRKKMTIRAGAGKHASNGEDPRAELTILAMKAIREVCADRGARMVLAVHGGVASLVVQIFQHYLAALTRRHPTAGGSHDTSSATESLQQALAQPTVLEEALHVVLRMSGNVSDYPCSHLFASLVHLLARLDHALAAASQDSDAKGLLPLVRPVEGFAVASDVLKTILSRFTLITISWLPECAMYETSMRPWFKPYSALTIVDKDGDPSYGSYPHPLACCYGRTVRATLRLGHQDVPCILRVFTNADMDRHIAGPGLLPDQDPSEVPHLLDEDSAAVVKEQRRALFRCAAALQLQDAVENSRTRAPHQLACMGFTSWEDTHATIYAAPPQYTLRMILLGIHAQDDPSSAMLFSAWVHLAIVLMETIVFLDKLQSKCVHGNLDLDHIFCNEDLSRECEPAFVLGPAVAIPADVVDLVPPEDTQHLFTKEEFAETASRTLLDDDNDARRALLEALYYGQEDEVDDRDDGDIMERVTRKIPPAVAHAVFGLKSATAAARAHEHNADALEHESLFATMSPYRKSPTELLAFLTAFRDRHIFGPIGSASSHSSSRSGRLKSRRIPLSPYAELEDFDDAPLVNISQISAI